MSPAQLLDQEFLRIGLSADEQALVPVIEIVSTLQYLADEYTDSKVDYLSLRLCGDVVPYVRIVFDQEFPQLSIALP